MNWNNVNLNDGYERSQNLLDPYNFDTLLLEVSCNIKEINTETVKAQAMESMRAKYYTAVEILSANIENITAKAIEERNK